MRSHLDRLWIGITLLWMCCLLLVANAVAQMPISTSTTSTPIPGVGHDYLGVLAETVNPANGSLSIRIGTPMPPARGMTVPFYFAYDSTGVSYVGNNSGGTLAWLPPSSVVRQAD
ncbi:MAG: hypothetical protein WAM79_11235 [Candidatus Sulfotelmatobacter sp.]